MSLIDTAVVGNSSSLELAALGPGTVLCDQFCYIFMFLSVATSNLVATALALKKREEATEHLSSLLFVSLACGVGMFCFTYFGATPLMTAFLGAKNAALVPAALPYVQNATLGESRMLAFLGEVTNQTAESPFVEVTKRRAGSGGCISNQLNCVYNSICIQLQGMRDNQNPRLQKESLEI